jgi:hypothetical protein
VYERSPNGRRVRVSVTQLFDSIVERFGHTVDAESVDAVQ